MWRPLNESSPRQIPPREHKNHLTACITAKLWRLSHLSNVAFEGISSWLSLVILCYFFSFCEKDALQGVGQGLAQGAASVNYRPLPLSKKTCCWLWCGLCAIPVFHKHLVQNDVRHFRQQLLVFSRWTLDHCEWVWMGMINRWIYYWRETLCYNLSL